MGLFRSRIYCAADRAVHQICLHFSTLRDDGHANLDRPVVNQNDHLAANQNGDLAADQSNYPAANQNDRPTADENQRSSQKAENLHLSEPEKLDLRLRRNTSEIRIRKMEIEAIKSLASGVTSLILLSCPSIIFVSSMNICRYFSTVQKCNQYAWFSLFVRFMYQLYGV